MRCGVIDLGSNTFHALVAEVDRGQIRTRVFEDKIAVRIGEHAFASRWIGRDAFAKGIGALGQLLSRVRATPCDALKLVATGVFREARATAPSSSPLHATRTASRSHSSTATRKQA
jgi:exopolyphosphatase/guanosine-5'-triphosphate,3'-diphosphate pyrophosphatase